MALRLEPSLHPSTRSKLEPRRKQYFVKKLCLVALDLFGVSGTCYKVKPGLFEQYRWAYDLVLHPPKSGKQIGFPLRLDEGTWSRAMCVLVRCRGWLLTLIFTVAFIVWMQAVWDSSGSHCHNVTWSKGHFVVILSACFWLIDKKCFVTPQCYGLPNWIFELRNRPPLWVEGAPPSQLHLVLI